MKFTLGTNVDQTNFFCRKCRAKAESLVALREKLKNEEKELLLSITTAFQSNQALILNQGQPGQRKRSLPDPITASTPVDKAIRQDESNAESIVRQPESQEESGNSNVPCEDTQQALGVSVSV